MRRDNMGVRGYSFRAAAGLPTAVLWLDGGSSYEGAK